MLARPHTLLLVATLALTSACGVPSKYHARTVRDLELSRARLSDKARELQTEKDQLTEALAAKERELEDEKLLKMACQQELTTLQAELAAPPPLCPVLPSNLQDIYPSKTLSATAVTTKGLFIPEAKADVAVWLGAIPQTSTLWILAYGNEADNEPSSSALLAIRVADALKAEKVSASRLRSIALGATSPRCIKDQSVACLAENRRVLLVALPSEASP
jgi:hypothetical protein